MAQPCGGPHRFLNNRAPAARRNMDIIKIHYAFTFDDGREEVFDLAIDSRSLEVLNTPADDLPEWTRLEFHQCAHCPFTPAAMPHCPVAVCLIQVIGRFQNVVSHNETVLTVTTDERQVSQRTTAQKGISSLLGLLFAASGCPHTSYFKPMARYHLPLSSEDETYYRATAMYLLAQYMRHKKGLEVDLELDGLKSIYRNVHKLNTMIAERIRSATRADSSVNAVVLLDMISNLMPFVLDENMDKILPLFSSYLPAAETGQ